jgi:hypothetical protein
MTMHRPQLTGSWSDAAIAVHAKGANQVDDAERWAREVMECIVLHQQAEALAKSITAWQGQEREITQPDCDRAYHTLYRQRVSRLLHRREKRERAA